jgi:hypothetical protein
LIVGRPAPAMPQHGDAMPEDAMPTRAVLFVRRAD